MKISIDVYSPGLAGAADDLSLYHSLMTGCLETRKRLGKLAEAIEAIRIKWMPLERFEVTPKFQIEIHICDPVGRKFHYKVNSGIFAENLNWSEAIPVHLCDKERLPALISLYWNSAFPVPWQKACLEWQQEYVAAGGIFDLLNTLRKRIDHFVIYRQKQAEAYLVRDIGRLLISQDADVGLRNMVQTSLDTYA